MASRYDYDGRRGAGRGWGMPAVIIAAILVIGSLFYFNSGTTTSITASNDLGVARTTNAPMSGPSSPNASVPAPAPVAPAR